MRLTLKSPSDELILPRVCVAARGERREERQGNA